MQSCRRRTGTALNDDKYARAKLAKTHAARMGAQANAINTQANMTPAGLESAIPGSVGRCLIHWATGPMETAIGP